MSPARSHAELGSWIREHLDPLEDDPPAWNGAPASPARMAGWLEQPERENRPAAVLIGIVERSDDLAVILTRRADHLRKHTGQIALPGGSRDPGETPLSTALREAQEEIGLHPGFVTPIGQSTPHRSRDHIIIPVVGLVAPGFTLQPDPNEVADVFETPFGFLMDPANHQLNHGLTPAGDRRTYYAMTHADRHIWGVTAGILRTLYERLYGVPAPQA